MASLTLRDRAQRTRVLRPAAGVSTLLPNLITSGALFSGFYAIVASMNGNAEAAAMALFAAMVLDAADGQVARLTRTEVPSGLSTIAFPIWLLSGVAPALLVFQKLAK